MKNYQVVVGNIGTVYDGDDFRIAQDCYSEYVKQSKEEYGRAGGEDVTLFEDGEIASEFIGDISLAIGEYKDSQ